MNIKPAKHFLLASDFDQTLSFNDSGCELSELLGISGFEQKVAGLSASHLVQQGGELAYLIRHDPEYRGGRLAAGAHGSRADPRGGGMNEYLGWVATAVFVSSYFFKQPALLRAAQMGGATLWIVYGLMIGAVPVVVANGLVFAAAAWTMMRAQSPAR